MHACDRLPRSLASPRRFSAARPAAAQDYPARPIRVITATSAGGTSDIFMRALGDEMHKRLGQPIVIENRPGGAFNIGARACAEAAPDGYTICILPGEPLVFNQFLFKSLAFDPAAFEPVTQLFTIVQALVVEQIAQRQHAVRAAGAVEGEARHAQLFHRRRCRSACSSTASSEESGADIVRGAVPRRRRGGECAAVAARRRSASYGLSDVRAQMEAGLVTGLMVDSDKRSPLFPDIPTIPEATGKELRRALLLRPASRRPARRSRSPRGCRPRSRASRPQPDFRKRHFDRARARPGDQHARRVRAASSGRTARSPRRSSRKRGLSRSSGAGPSRRTIKPVSRQAQAGSQSLSAGRRRRVASSAIHHMKERP